MFFQPRLSVVVALSEITQHQDCSLLLWHLELQPRQQHDPEKEVPHCPPENVLENITATIDVAAYLQPIM